MNQPNTGKFNYAVVNLTTSQPQFIFPANSTLYLPMGFNRGSTNMFSSSYLTKDTIFIKSNFVANSTKLSYKKYIQPVTLISVSFRSFKMMLN